MFESLKNLLKHFTGSQESDSSASTTHDSLTNSHSTKTTDIHYHTLGEFNLGIGTIGPTNRNDIDQKTLTDMYQAVAAGKFNIPVNGAVPEICVDGRTDKHGNRKQAPCAAGGTLSIVYGGDLGGAATASDTTETELTVRIISMLKAKGHATGVHGDDHSNCGCGACAKAKTIYQHITEHINDIAALVSKYGISLTDTEKEAIVQQAQNRINQPDFFADDRSSILQAAQDNGSIFEELVGVHNELGIALNTKPGTTIDRSAIRARYGSQYDVFVVDAWSFGTAANDVNPTGAEQDAQRIAKAITLQNVATASVLGHGSLSIIPIA